MLTKLKFTMAVGLILSIPMLVSAAGEQSGAQSQANSISKTEFKNESDKLSYIFGAQVGGNFKTNDFKLNSQLFMAGLNDSYNNQQLALSQADAEQSLKAFQEKVMAKRNAAAKELAQKNEEQGKQFLEANAKAADVHSLQDGLQYKVLTKGSGATPKSDDVVTVNYEGKFINGKVFDSSFKRGEPATFSLSEVIPGWQEVLQDMQVGSTWEVVVPAKLAYGQNGMGEAIGPNQTLIFKIELLGIRDKG